MYAHGLNFWLAQCFDSKYQATERAAALIQPMLDQAAKAFDDLATTATKIQEDVKASVVVEVGRPILILPVPASEPTGSDCILVLYTLEWSRACNSEFHYFSKLL